MPKVSICIPTYLQTEYLKRTLDSILSQDFDDYEVIITDDSPDTTVEALVRGYPFGPRLTYVRNLKRLGSPANWNRSVKLSSGEYIKILHHDDWFFSCSSLSEYVEMLDSNPHSGFAFSGAIAQVAGNRKTWHHFASKIQVARLRNEPTSLFFGNIVGPPSSTIIRRSSFLEYDENLIWAVDLAQYIHILCKISFVSTEKPLIFSITQAPHQVTNSCVKNKRINIFEYFYLYDNIKDSIPYEARNIYLNYLIKLILMYEIRSEDELREFGYKGFLPSEILSAMKNPILAHIMRIFKFDFLKH